MADEDDVEYARAPEPEDVVRLCRSLDAAGARYLLIGGFAVVVHGAGRFTKDIDLLVDPSPSNVARVKQALSVLADNAAAEVEDDDVQRHVVVRVIDEVIVDLMGRACGVDYAAAAADAESIEIDGVAIRVPSPEMLIQLKNTARPQDAIDRAFLQGVIEARHQERGRVARSPKPTKAR